MTTRLFVLLMFISTLMFCVANNVRADGVSACIEKARIASQVARALNEGYPLDKINFTYPAAHNQEEVDQATAVVEVIKAATAKHYAAAEGKDQRVERATQAYLEQCAYEYGKSLLHKSASSERLGDRLKRCAQALEDEGYIAQLAASGQDFGSMRSRASGTFQACEQAHCVGFGLERFNKIQKLIDEAERSGDVPGWYEKKRVACMGDEI